MEATNHKTGLIIAFIVVVVLFLLFVVGAMTGPTWGRDMMASGSIGNVSWMWIPTVLTLGIGLLLGWTIFGKK
jgi:hypothetical protein